MKILVVKERVKRIGGSIASILMFSDVFKELGHEVTILTQEDDWNIIETTEDLLSLYNCKYLTPDDFQWDIETRYSESIEEIDEYDLIFTREVCHNRYFRCPEKKTVLWIVVHDSPRQRFRYNYFDSVIESWTNSKTTAKRVKSVFKDCQVVVPPHDYSIFRDAFREEKDRDIDFIHIGRSNEPNDGKGNYIFDNVVNSLGAKGILISTALNQRHRKTLDKIKVPIKFNIPKHEVAELMGRSKYFLFPSKKESCPLSVYEALNAGCVPIVRDVGAVKEQLAGHGFIFEKNKEIVPLVKKVRNMKHDRRKKQIRGTRFDRINAKKVIEKRLEEIVSRDDYRQKV